jgi:biopolymer transport protein ExbD
VAFSTQNGMSSPRGRRGGMASMAEINIVPLVDVVLVLLVIFMLTAHVMEFGLEIEVPKVKQVRDSAQQLPVVSITRAGELFLNDKPANIHQLGAEVRRRFPTAKAVYVRADKAVMWGVLAPVIATLGDEKIEPRMVTQPDDGRPK